MTTEPTYISPEQLQSQELFDASAVVEWVKAHDIEVAHPEHVAARAAELVETFEINRDILEEGRNKLLLTAIANELGDQPFGDDEQASARVADMVALGFGKHTKFKQAFENSGHEPGFSEQRTEQAYETLTNNELSAKLDQYIHTDPDFAAVRERLGLTLDSEAPFTVRVLEIGNSSTMYGWQPAVDWTNLPYDEATRLEVAQKEARDKLLANEAYLQQESGMAESQAYPPAWITKTEDGSVTLCMPLPTADKILNPDAARASYYDKNRDLTNDKAIVMHEFTHTQKPVLREDHIGLGIALEELRAEHFSGDRHGYTDIKRYFSTLKTLYGYSPKDSFESRGSFDPEFFELDIAQAMGLEGYLDAMTLIPESYANDESANAYLKGLVVADGGMDGHFNNMYNRAIEKVGEQEIEDRIRGFVDTIVNYHNGLENGVVSVPSLISYGRPRQFVDQALKIYAERTTE